MLDERRDDRGGKREMEGRDEREEREMDRQRQTLQARTSELGGEEDDRI